MIVGRHRRVDWVLFVALLAGACGGSKKIETGEACTLNSDCRNPLSCSFGKCHETCVQTRDCPLGQSCVMTSAGGVCQLPEEADCRATGVCAAGLLCAVDYRCRSTCQGAAGCSAGQVCVGGVCAEPGDVDTAGNLPVKNPGASVPGQGGGTDGGLILSGSDASAMTGDSGASSGGLGACQERAATGSSPLIDDLNDGDGLIPNSEGRQGGWLVYNDGTGSQWPAIVGDCPPWAGFSVTDGQACTHGSGFTGYGAAIAVKLNTGLDCSPSCGYDATAYRGVRFTISGSVNGGRVRVQVGTAETHPVQYGGTCAENACNDEYGKIITVTSSPKVIEIPWADLQQQGWGTKLPFNLRRLFQLSWMTQPSGGGGGATFDYCVDDVSFF